VYPWWTMSSFFFTIIGGGGGALWCVLRGGGGWRMGGEGLGEGYGSGALQVGVYAKQWLTYSVRVTCDALLHTQWRRMEG
jgi:hypothetical protein